MRPWFLSLTVLALFIGTANPADAGVILVGSRGDLAGDDSINWGSLGSDGDPILSSFGTSPTLFPPPTGSITTENGLGVTGTVQRIVGPTGDLTIGTLSGTPSIEMEADPFSTLVGFGPRFASQIILEFDSPVFAVGADISAFSGRFGGGFSGATKIDAYNSAGVSIGAVILSPQGAFDGFGGIRTDSLTADIAEVRFQSAIANIPAGTGNLLTRLEINQVDIVTGTSPDPEPSSLALLGMGALGMLGYGRKRTQSRKNA